MRSSARKRHSHCSLKLLFGCFTCVIVSTWLFFLFGHHLLCPLNVALCTPLVYWYRRMPLIYEAVNIHDSDTIDVEWQKANTALTCDLASDAIENIDFIDLSHESHVEPTYLPLNATLQTQYRQQYAEVVATPHIRRLILLGIARGGTTWAKNVLGKHPSIEMHGEVLFSWTTSYCNGHWMLNDASRCNWDTIQALMETFYVQHMYRYVNRLAHSQQQYDQYVGFKITLQQLMPTMYGEFVRWVYCRNITVIQLIRSASINAFYSSQAETFEVLFYGRPWLKTLTTSKHSIHNETFDLDATWAKHFVENTDFWQHTLMKLLKFHTKDIKILVVYYEDLISPHHVSYLNAMQSFLNVKYDENLYRNQEYTIARLHATPCHAKIKNWYSDVKPALVETASYFACQKDNS